MIHARSDYNERVKCVDGSIPEDEPVFLLRAQDATAVSTLRFWIDQQCLRSDGDDRSVILALEHLERMQAWEPKKTADTPEGI